MNKAIFLDRDGVINHPKRHYYVYRIKDLIINKGIYEALKYFQKKGYLLIIITNQGGISKGKYSKDNVDLLHDHMLDLFKKEGISITDIYYCPHHTVNEECLCRKPKPLMLEKAIARYKIDKKSSWFIGDKESDIEAGRSAGVNTLKIRKNQNLLKRLTQIS